MTKLDASAPSPGSPSRPSRASRCSRSTRCGWSSHGAAGDRRFFLVDADGRLFNAERLGPLVGVQARYDAAGNTLELRFPDGAVVSGEVSTNGTVETRLFGGPVVADRS